MKILYKFALILLLFIGVFLSVDAQDSGFIVKKRDDNDNMQNYSKNRLKESIGDKMKDVLYSCAELNNQIGRMQIGLANIQKEVVEKVEKLVDNKPPFKKASKIELTQAFKIINTVKKELSGQIKVIKRLKEQMDSNNCLKQNSKAKVG